MRKIILYIASSLDGFIADKNDSLDWLTVYHGNYGYEEFMKTIDTVLMGRKTYDWVAARGMSNPYPDQKSFVFTSAPEKFVSTSNLQFTSDDPIAVAKNLLAEKGNNIFLVGGGELIARFVQENLVDEYILFIVPVLLGDGRKLFLRFDARQHLKTVSARTYDDGMIELRFVRTSGEKNH